MQGQAAEFRARFRGTRTAGRWRRSGSLRCFRPAAAATCACGFRGDGKVPMYVSRGIGEPVLPVRFGSVPELAAFTMGV